MRIDSVSNCAGCRVCETNCFKNAVSIAADAEGFYYPVINESLCVHCGACYVACPDNMNLFNENAGYPKLLINKNKTVLKQSTSGGLFFEIANHILDTGGAVFGCCLSSDLYCRHVCVSQKNDIYVLQGSKYIESDFSIYAQVDELLKQNKPVLVSGTPCQIAGIKSKFGKSPRLFTAELVCHGVPSAKLFRKYIESLETKHNINIKQLKFRDKRYAGWSCGSGIRIDSDRKGLTINGICDPYYMSFLRGENFRNSCYSCKYKNIKRTADLTIGDGWGINKLYPDTNAKDGCSFCLVNNDKGKYLFDAVSSKFNIFDLTIQECTECNPSLTEQTQRPEIRTDFYRHIDTVPAVSFFSSIKTASASAGVLAKYKRLLFYYMPFGLKKLLRRIFF